MMLKELTQQICQENGIKPARSRGQNFLIAEEAYDEIVAAAKLGKKDSVLEVGPGLGFLTERLAEVCKQVISVEVDEKLAKIAKNRLEEQGIDNVEILNGNVLDYIPTFKRGEYKVVANLPYNISSIFLRKFLTMENKPSSLTLMLQKEVAERIAAKPPKLSILGISAQFYADVELIAKVKKEDFWPIPKVESAVIKLDTVDKYEVDEKKFFQLVKIGFSSKRKKLKNNLSAGYRISAEEADDWLKKAGFSQNVRAQELAIDDWIKLLKFV